MLNSLKLSYRKKIMTQLSVGKETVTHCGKCKLNLAHMIVTMKDTITPYKVECKTCRSTHIFRSSAPKSTSSSTSKSSVKTKSVKVTSVHQEWEQMMKSHEKNPVIPYKMSTTFQLGDVMSHPTFGDGVVQGKFSNEKIEVIFASDIKTLIHAKS
jgi:hypothetical protein